MKITQLIYLCLLLACLQACNSVTGPVHFYSGQPRPADETARLQIPAAITVVKIDGKEVKVPSKEEGFYHVYLLPGVHRVDFRYELAWGDNVSGMLIRSDVVGVESQFFAGLDYELRYRVPGEQEEAYEMAMANEFKATLVEKKTGRHVASRSITELNEFRPTNTSLPNNAVITSPVVASVPVTKSAVTSVPRDIDADTATQENAVKRLKFWWLMANEKERKQFLEWKKSIDKKE